MRTLIFALAFCVACTMAEDNLEPLRAVSNSAEQFSTNFFKTISAENKGKNLISSPLSAHIVLSMAAYGAGGNTAKQMRETLHLPAEDALGRQGFQDLMDELSHVENVTLEVANKMYVEKQLKMKSEYKQLTAGPFRSEASQIDTQKPIESAQVINSWVDEKTHHKINKIVNADDITPDTRMVLLNAVYFKGKWAKKFEPRSTTERNFHLDANNEKSVPTMYNMGRYVYGELPDLKAKFIELPYENKDIKMVIIVPDEIEGLKQIEENLEAFSYQRLARSGYEREVELYLPKFKIESTIPLNDPLSKMGMNDMFTDAANFSGIADEPLKVAKVLQKAYIEVNEEGSEAAAVTVMNFAPASAFIPSELPPVLNADRPFMYKIVNKRTNVTLFVGHINNPGN